MGKNARLLMVRVIWAAKFLGDVFAPGVIRGPVGEQEVVARFEVGFAVSVADLLEGVEGLLVVLGGGEGDALFDVGDAVDAGEVDHGVLVVFSGGAFAEGTVGVGGAEGEGGALAEALGEGDAGLAGGGEEGVDLGGRHFVEGSGQGGEEQEEVGHGASGRFG